MDLTPHAQNTSSCYVNLTLYERYLQPYLTSLWDWWRLIAFCPPFCSLNPDPDEWCPNGGDLWIGVRHWLWLFKESLLKAIVAVMAGKRSESWHRNVHAPMCVCHPRPDVLGGAFGADLLSLLEWVGQTSVFPSPNPSTRRIIPVVPHLAH